MIKKIGVVGAGTMGHGIAEVAAIAGFKVSIVDISWDFLNRAKERITDSLKKFYEKGSLSEKPETVLSRIEFSTSYDIMRDADFVIEAVPELIELKKNVFKTLDEITPRYAILASNTSSIPISVIAESTKRPEKVIGMHFFNPPPIMKLVEIIPSKYTSEEVVNITIDLAKKMGKVPVRLKVEVPGFVSNRIFLRLMQEACREVEDGEATIEEVDSTARNKLKLPMGIFELSDYVGLDVAVDLWKVIVSSGTAEDVKCSLFQKKVDAKELGVKSGKGFYIYPAAGKYKKVELQASSKVDPARLISLAVNESAWLIQNKIVNAKEIDTVMIYGFNFPKGLLEMADELGLDIIYNHLKDIYSKGYKAYRPNDLLEEMIKEGKIGKKCGKGFYDYKS
ncbi:MAG: 3-hydroxyacyl-CoA dehydrogenase NAD-binding domain-containing protein [Saccharolobus sp.]|jgi:3-hydroxybutyryl-CoA dehydrogenase|uniref:3-hydroxyacyl-CoA dehydrogenase n=1 Tax=Saccharolobus sp. TaxID=2100761 RepID=UPI0028CDF095|nr:3-hydroxyacyl-CoA dehydrogenase NAD-binding domain-containing protein [Saccharolobus sp.]MDT7862192.1 3-hydroxyacyl-CoA dehydrogenase NAD-binding domain-containing protein [Saccharolobus sp.]